MVLYSCFIDRGDETMQRLLKGKPPSLPLGETLMGPEELRRILMRLDITQDHAAKLLGRSPRTIRRWLAGERAIGPEAAILLRLLARDRIGADDIEQAHAAH
jgi:DNA-binding transcriptional regulator YiaG